MKRAELEKLLEKLGADKSLIDDIMGLHGRSVEEIKKGGEASAAEVARLTKELADASKAIDGFKALDIEGVKKSADEWKSKFEKAEADRAAEKKALEKKATATEILAGMKPKSELVKKAALADLLAAMDGDKFKAEKWAKEYVEANASDFGEEKKAGGMRHDAPPDTSDDSKLRKAMGLPEKK